MTKKARTTLFFLSSLCLFLSQAVFGFDDDITDKTLLNKTIATVNGVVIKNKDFKWAYSSEMVRLVTTHGYLTPEEEQELKTKTFERLINRELLYQESTRVGIEISPMDVETAYNRARSQMLAPVDHEKIQNNLDLSVEDIKEEFRRAYAAQKLVDQNVKVNRNTTEDEIKAYFEANRALFNRIGRVKVSHILIEIPKNAAPAQKALARSDMEMVKQKLNQGESFEDLAKQYSTSNDRVNGGNIGYIQKGRTDPAFEKAAYALKPGQVSDVVETSYGFHLLKVTEKEPDPVITLASVHDEVKKYLLADREVSAIDRYIQSLKAKSTIEIYTDPLTLN